jgi:hypothetical protein
MVRDIEREDKDGCGPSAEQVQALAPIRERLATPGGNGVP